MEDIKAKISVFLNSGYGNGNGDGYDSGYDSGYGYGDGYGDGSGYGDGYGDGSGDGSGSGSGSGYGYGYGDGSGSGDGYGYGDGSGSGSGSGSGYGYGYGDGSGDGYGIKKLGGADVYCIDDVYTVIHDVKGNIARGAIIRDDLTLLPCYIAKVDGYFAHDETAHKAYESAVAKALLDEPIEQRVARFVAKYPDPDAKIPAKELFDWHYILTGSCGMGRREFARAHNIDIDTASFTANEFIELTICAYGGENIAQLKQSYNNH